VEKLVRPCVNVLREAKQKLGLRAHLEDTESQNGME
jgi:hypothetical protein